MYHIPNMDIYQKLKRTAEYQSKYINKRDYIFAINDLRKWYINHRDDFDDFVAKLNSLCNNSVKDLGEHLMTTNVKELLRNMKREEKQDIMEPVPVPQIPVVQRDQGPRVQLYDPSDVTKVVKSYETLTDAVRKEKDAAYTSIKTAAKTRTIYLGYRWHLVDRDDETPIDQAREIGETVEKRDKNLGLVAVTNKDRTVIEKVFQLQKEVAEYLGQHVSAISVATKQGTKVSGKYVIPWDDIPCEIQQIYLETNKLPTMDKKTRGYKVVLLDAHTLQEVKSYPSVTDFIKEHKISTKTVKKLASERRAYNGYRIRLELNRLERVNTLYKAKD